ncbi:MAG: hypothetical protein FWC47_16000, partial [Oscillospiraceae bacterium]|nr:hypothetical protein [Oscillospiraceae bacterium]
MLKNKIKAIIALIILIIISISGILYFNGKIKINFKTKDQQIDEIVSFALSSTMSNNFEDSLSILSDGNKKFPNNLKIMEMELFNYYIMDDIENGNSLIKRISNLNLDIYDKEFLLKYSILTRNDELRRQYTDELEKITEKTQNIYYLLGLSYLSEGNIEKKDAYFKLGFQNSTFIDRFNSKYYMRNSDFNKIYDLLSGEWSSKGFTVDMFFNTKSLLNDKFMDYIKKKYEDEPNNFNKLILAILYYEAGKYKDAISLVEDLPNLDNNISYSLLLSSLYDKQNDPVKAQKIKGEIVAMNYKDPFIHYILAKDAIINKDYGKAISEGMNSLKLNSNYLNVYFDIFYNYYNDKKDVQNSKISLLESLFYDPFNDEIYNLLGILCFNEKDYEKSIEYFKYAYNLNESVADYFSNIANVYIQNNDTINAISSLESSLSLEENDETLDYLSFEYIKNHDFDKAFSTLTKLSIRNPNEDKYKYELASLNCYLKKYDDALKLFEEIKSPLADSLYFKSNVISAKYFLYKIDKKTAIDEITALLKNSDIKDDLKNGL